jgi:hypothetical protein
MAAEAYESFNLTIIKTLSPIAYRLQAAWGWRRREMCLYEQVITIYKATWFRNPYRNTCRIQKNCAVSKVINKLFLSLHRHNIRVYCQQWKLSRYLMRYSSSLLMLTTGPRDQFPRWRHSRRRLCVCSVLRCPDLWLQCRVSFVHGLIKTLFLCGVSS